MQPDQHQDSTMKICLCETIFRLICFKFELLECVFSHFTSYIFKRRSAYLQGDICKTLQLTPKQSRWIISTNLLILIFFFGGGGMNCPFKYNSRNQRATALESQGQGWCRQSLDDHVRLPSTDTHCSFSLASLPSEPYSSISA